MKNIAILFLSLLISAASVAQIQTIDLGTGANMRDGDPIRTAFDKTNDNFDYVQDELDAIDARIIKVIGLAASDETTAITGGTAKLTFRMPYAMTVTEVRASLNTAQTSGSVVTIDINENGTSILSTKLTIDNTEKTSTTATTAAVVSDTSLADDAEITIDIPQIGDGTGEGLKVWLIGN